ncbi:hypothetical protein KOM00_05610 [Geomonas sp. Red69]|uniref:hypothetical protein n=1 Tax=Geomonas diazotrophica TaxID=2843197 RepID=UPI001C11740D|nr:MULTISPECIES: hypothetical protein [Geomonas]MBU5636204.1 hypothetical protein [Geomonas diazotrophica]QXE85167.1 hypothetical protein KP003_12260 [Geomonas nitrogeniifigens]
MQSVRISVDLFTALTGALLTISPMTSRAAEHAPNAYGEPSATYAPEQVFTPDVGVAAWSDLSVESDVVRHAKERIPHGGSEQDDLSGALLEEMVKMDQGQPVKRP